MTPSAVFLIHPLIGALKGKLHRARLPHELNKQGVMIAIVVLSGFLAYIHISGLGSILTVVYHIVKYVAKRHDEAR